MAEPSRLLIVVPNHVAESPYAVAGGGELGELGFYTGAGADNALSEDPSDVTRWIERRGNVMSVQFDSSAAATAAYFNKIDFIGLAGLVCSSHALVRFTDQYPLAEYLSPTSTPASGGSIVTAGGGAGNHTDLDEGIGTPDSLYVRSSLTDHGAPSGPTATGVYIRVRFPAPTYSPLKSGTGYQHFAMVARLASSAGEGGQGIIGCQLYQNGVFKADLGYRRVGAVGPVSLIFPWDSSVLTGASNVEAHVTFWWGDTSAATDRPELGSVTWGTINNSAVPTGPTIVETGYLSVQTTFYNDASSTTSIWGPSGARYQEELWGGSRTRPRNVWWQKSKSASQSIATVIYVHILDDGLPIWSSTENSLPETQVQPLEFAALVVGFSQELSCTPVEGDFFELVDPSDYKRTAGGQRYGVRRVPYGRLKLKFEDTTDPEAWEVLERVQAQRLGHRPFFAVLHPDESTGSFVKKYTSGYWYVGEMTPVAAKNQWDDSTMLSPISLTLEGAI